MSERKDPQRRPWAHRHGPFLVLLALGLIVRLAFACLPLPQLLILLEDDAWMVTAIARNFALGRGISADGLNPTNGFHPLYPLTLGTLPYLLAPQALDAGFRANLVFCALLSAAAAIPLYHLARRLAGERGALLAVAVYALNPFFARVTVNAMDTALGLLLLLWLGERYYALDRQRWPAGLLLGLLAGLAGLARLDNWLLAATLGLALLGEVLRRRTSWAFLVAYGLGIVLLASPYFAYNQVVFGALGPSSGRALAYMHSYAGGFSLTNILHFIYLNPALHLGFLPSPFPALGIGLLLLVAYFVLLPRATRRLLLPVAGFVLLQLLYYAYLQQNSNPRYFVGPAAFFCLFLGCLYARLEPRRVLQLAVGLSVVLLAAGLNTLEAISTYRDNATMPQLTQPAIYQAALWVRDNLPDDALLAAKNSGILQYYSGHVVLNIDGKLNAEIVPVLEERQLLPYLRQKGVQYLVDREAAIAGHLTLYSQDFGPWPGHRELTIGQRLQVYAQLLLSRLGLGAAPALDDPAGFCPSRPFDDAVEVLATFPRPNSPVDPVRVYRMK